MANRQNNPTVQACDRRKGFKRYTGSIRRRKRVPNGASQLTLTTGNRFSRVLRVVQGVCRAQMRTGVTSQEAAGMAGVECIAIVCEMLSNAEAYTGSPTLRRLPAVAPIPKLGMRKGRTPRTRTPGVCPPHAPPPFVPPPPAPLPPDTR